LKVHFRSSFVRDLKRIKDRAVLRAVKQAIEQLEAAEQPADIGGLRKLTSRGPYYRIRIGEYRLGLAMQDGMVECVRCLHRREIYQRFP
jgi:mRNA interferase RelE/StbE